MTTLPTQARAIVIGGGIIGCSTAYHLAKLGWKDVVLLERKQLTCGTTWHAAGLLGQGRASPSAQRITAYSTKLYDSLEAETGISTGIKRNRRRALISRTDIVAVARLDDVADD